MRPRRRNSAQRRDSWYAEHHANLLAQKEVVRRVLRPVFDKRFNNRLSIKKLRYENALKADMSSLLDFIQNPPSTLDDVSPAQKK